MLIVATPGKFHIKQDEIVGLIYPDVILPSLIKNKCYTSNIRKVSVCLHMDYKDVFALLY